ncbi:N-acetyl-1-D-myo-inositol-2-amino-2-deoxy-alpha-D-glucopyranoside deacetylase [Desertihabitans aurantiacus]|uniref:N-acetyl-1-D-myo-inositol-2-amino-2-deoxy-alpha- D-glucopyranoside deacetylase n=1 Tax=Desertihabitans aurantiacus TaxID=2282477 RepID=UPI001E423C35|nr:N-acetyl-1-D-myo-inositol-2-amino-2-deoxy-alpha-D-glucopyranoside deacetylase [Desertihabitans aurantiacus]
MTSHEVPARRVMFVHAHPDDESSQTSAAMARYVAEGAQVTLVTCTLGERGEIVSDDLSHLSPGEELGRHRVGELAEAMAVLGVTDFVRLGGDGAYHDSGMADGEDGMATVGAELDPRAFWLADLREAAEHLVALIRDRRPQVLVTYDQIGGYGHPDHVQAHRVATYAVALAGVPSFRRDLGEAWAVPRVLWSAMSASAMKRAVERMRESGGDPGDLGGFDLDNPPPMLIPDEDLAVRIDGTPWAEQKAAALAAHRSQVSLEDPFWRLFTTGTGWADEYYRLAQGVPFPDGVPGDGLADDLFAGLR